MNRLTDRRRASIVLALVEGKSVRSTARVSHAAKATVMKLLVEIGRFCSIYQDHAIRNLKSTRIETDKIAAYVGAKRTSPAQGSPGDLWTYTAIDADSKLMVSWLVGSRYGANEQALVSDVAKRVARHIQLTTDGMSWRVSPVKDGLCWNGNDYAQMILSCAPTPDSGSSLYGRMERTRIVKPPINGNAEEENVHTSDVERPNLNTAQSMQRFSRLTDRFSAKAENLAHAVSLFFMFYNYCRPHDALTTAANGSRTTPAIVAGLTDHLWSVEEILERMRSDYLLHLE